MSAHYQAFEQLRSRRYLASHRMAAAVLRGDRKESFAQALEFQRLDDEALELTYNADAAPKTRGTK